jgi:N-acetylneuraminic acid mutarotase
VGTPGTERLARRRARARAIRRRRAGALLVLALVAALIVGLATRAGSGGHAGRARTPGGSRRATASEAVHVAVSAVGRLPTALRDGAAAPAYGGGVLLLGGLTSGEESVADVTRIVGATTSPLASLPTALHDACAAAVGGAVYVFGGGQQASFSAIVKVAADGTSGQVGSLPTPASDVACVVVGDTVYIVGGYTGSEPLRTILAWRPGASAHVVGMLPKPLRYAAVGQVGGQVLIAGGTSGVDASRDVYRFDPRSGTVREVALLPSGVTHAAGASLPDAVLVIGGRRAGSGSQRQTILALSPGGAVTVAGSLPHPLSDIAAAPEGSAIVLAGGADREGATREEILRLTTTR